jgi:hypothetical protein
MRQPWAFRGAFAYVAITRNAATCFRQTSLASQLQPVSTSSTLRLRGTYLSTNSQV